MRRLLPVLACCCSMAWAADAPRPAALQGCPVGPIPDMPDLGPVDSSDPRIDVITGHAEMDLQKGAVFDDEIRIRRGDGVLTAPNGRFDRQTGEFLLENGLRYRSPQSAVSGSPRQLRHPQQQPGDRGRRFRPLHGTLARQCRRHRRRPGRCPDAARRHLHHLRPGPRGLAAARQPDQDRP
ncbi:MAG: hypothetical protein M5U09_25745 [Gammaproteobacteria bacterium]|nr:hypothetical protein [Gammaproteobacteria bacterium]